jgi:hypothetical protein
MPVRYASRRLRRSRAGAVPAISCLTIRSLPGDQADLPHPLDRVATRGDPQLR